MTARPFGHSGAGTFRWPHGVSIVAFGLGAGLATSFTLSEWEFTLVGFAKLLSLSALCTALWIGTGLTTMTSPAARWTGRLCWIGLAGFYALWGYLALSFGVLLAWTVPAWAFAAVALLGAMSMSTVAHRPGGLHVPVALPLGVWIAIVLGGWLREEPLLRCDDRLGLRPPVVLLIPNPQLAGCSAGATTRSGRFPRTTWETPDGGRLIFTTQGSPAGSGIDGAVCAASLDGSGGLQCVGEPQNKSQGLIDLPEYDRLLVMQWGIETPTGSRGAVIMALPRQGPLRVLSRHWFDDLMADGFYEPRNHTLYMISDRLNGIHRARVPGLERLPTLDVDLPTVGELRYDRELGEGVACGAGIGAAVHGDPWSARKFRDAATSPIDKLSISWGCDWDPVSRKVYSTVPNLGLLDRIDYDSGRVEKRWFVGFGMRSVAYDRARRRVYFTDFLRGEVLAFDETTERIVDRWFVGRFSRWVTLTRDGRALLATGNLGIVRIPLDAPDSLH
jgi:hypothetical protein